MDSPLVVLPSPVSACAHARSCPISHTACPKECVYADIMGSVQLGIAVFDLKAPSLLYLNAAGRELFARQHQPADLASLQALMFPPDIEPMDLPAEYQGPPLHLGTRIIGYSLYRANQFAWAFIRDITEKVRLESIAEAAETMNNIGTVFSAVRHELGNPINSVKAALSVLRYNLDSFPRPVLEEYLDRINGELNRVEDLLRSLRSFSMYEQLEPVAVDLGSFLDSFAALARPGLERRGVRLELEKKAPCAAQADPRALQQALVNLVANAADAAEGLPDSAVTVSACCVDGLARITVTDNGVGMDHEQLSRAFEPFRTTKAKGTGLGLTITRKLLLKMGGTVSLESEQGQGTRVRLTLPLARRGDAP